jgi:hypothetical protein
MNPEPQVRLHLYPAREAPRTVILRQGPSRAFRMILWHTDTDTFEHGQRVLQKVFTDRCDIAPDGRHFLCFLLDGRWQTPAAGAYTAICQPPLFTALALFPVGSTWGGGAFLDARRFVASGGEDILGRARGLVRVRRGAPGPANRTGLRGAEGARAPLPRATRRRLLTDAQPSPLPGDIVADGGRLLRRREGGLELIRDFTALRFERVRAPWDDSGRPPRAPERG